MSAVRPLAAVIPLAPRRPASRVTRRAALKAAALCGACLLGLIGSIADSLVALGEAKGFALAPIGAILGNIGACAGVAMILVWYLPRQSAEIVALRPRRLTKRSASR